MLTLDAQEPAAQLLKNHTAKNHLALEDMLLPHLKSITSAKDYIRILKSFYGYFKPVETLVERYIDVTVLPDIADRRKAGALIHDLTFLKAHTATLPLATRLPDVYDVCSAIGAMYVMEGSTLGGRGITKMLLANKEAHLFIDAMHFFNGYGTATGSRWTTFVQTLNQYTAPTDITAMIEAANQTFLYFKNWLEAELNNE